MFSIFVFSELDIWFSKIFFNEKKHCKTVYAKLMRKEIDIYINIFTYAMKYEGNWKCQLSPEKF